MGTNGKKVLLTQRRERSAQKVLHAHAEVLSQAASDSASDRHQLGSVGDAEPPQLPKSFKCALRMLHLILLEIREPALRV